MTGRPIKPTLERDADPQIALGRRAELRAQHKEVRVKLAGRFADGPEPGLARAEELYWTVRRGPDNENLWSAQFRLNERTGILFGLESAVRRLRNAQVELGTYRPHRHRPRALTAQPGPIAFQR